MNPLPFKKVLALAPHADDIELGAGATVSRLCREGASIVYYALSYPPDVDKFTIREELITATGILGMTMTSIKTADRDPHSLGADFVRQTLYDYSQNFKPDLVLCPNSKDIHQSHQVVYEEARRIFKHTTIWGYELPWNSFGFDNGVYIRVTEGDLVRKERAIEAYSSQRERNFFENPTSLPLAILRGIQIKTPLAECFENIRTIY